MSTHKKMIGGFLELELPKKGSVYHDLALALASGRICFKILLEQVKPTKVHVPFYCCDMLLTPLKELNISFEFYAINQDFDPINIPALAPTELFVFVNYFGLKNETAIQLSKKLEGQLVIDNTQAFFEKAYGKTWAFNSARKFFGVPDGGFLYSPMYLEDNFIPNNPPIIDHLWLSFWGKYDEAFQYFQDNKTQPLSNQRGMSEQTKRILYGVDFPNVARARKRNFRRLDYALRHLNLIPETLLEAVPSAVPFCYPLLLRQSIKKEELKKKKICLPQFGLNDMGEEVRGFEFEKSLMNNLLLLPVDHHLEDEDLRYIIDTILKA